MQRRSFLGCLASLATLCAIPVLPGCGPERPLAVGIHPWIGYETLHLCRDLGWLPAGVRLAEGRSAIDSLLALGEGRVEAACLTLDEVLRARSEGLPLTIALVFDVSAGADAVLAAPSIKTLADLAGKRIGVEQNAVGSIVLKQLLAEAGLPATAVTVVDLPVDRQLEAWRQGAVDALVTYDPTANELRRQGARLIFDSRRMPDTIFDVLALRTDLLRDRQTLVKALVASHFQALEHVRVNRQDAIYRIATHQGITPDEVVRSLGGITLPSLTVNRAYLANPGGRFAQAARSLSALMANQGLLPREDSLERLFSAAWLPPTEV